MEHRNFPRGAFVTSDGVQLSYYGKEAVVRSSSSAAGCSAPNRQKSSASTRLGFQKPKAQSGEENAKTLAEGTKAVAEAAPLWERTQATIERAMDGGEAARLLTLLKAL